MRSDTARLPDRTLSFTSPQPKSRDPIGPLARLMVAEGFDPETPTRIVRNIKGWDMPVFKQDRALGAWAGEDTYCRAEGGFRTRPYNPPSFRAGEGQNRGSSH